MFLKPKSKILIPLILSTLLLTGFLIAGNTSNTSTPEPTFYTLADIYNLIENNTPATEGNHSLTPSTTPDNATMYSISEIYVALANKMNADHIAPGITYLGVIGGETTPTPLAFISKEFTPTSNPNTTTGFTLNDIWNLITENERPLTPPERSFTPASTPAPTMHSLNDIYSELSNLITDPATIATGTTYLGVVGSYEEPVVDLCEVSGDATDPDCWSTVQSGLAWGPEDTSTDVLDEDNGLANTNVLVALGSQYEAAKYCYDLEEDGYSDWYLPAKNELWSGWQALGSSEFPIVLNGTYKSSTDATPYNNNNFAWELDTYYLGSETMSPTSWKSFTENSLRCLR